jgi:YidC/Oxa1 family membrane protein insertase
MNEILAAAMGHLATLFNGSMGWAILCLALSVRLALLPLTLHLSRRMLANQKKIKALQPEVEAIRTRLKAHPQQMFAEISALYKKNGARMFDRSGILGTFVQFPVFVLLYRAIGNAISGRGTFLWMKNLASPDAALTAIVLLLTAIASYYSPTAAADTAVLMAIAQVVVTALIVWKLSAGLGLYWSASALVNAIQTFVLRYDRRRLSANAVQ